ncbi:MAG: GNAT family N-acetyltransferase [Oscillospiraceae bacterium]
MPEKNDLCGADEKAILFTRCEFRPLTETAASEISRWAYEQPYDCYNFKGHPNGYLFNRDTWGKEQFYLADENRVIGFVSCQYDGGDLWVGWSLSPLFCGQGNGFLFIEHCVSVIRTALNHKGEIFLRVAAWNQRAIRSYQKAGFRCLKTIKDEIAYTNQTEDFWVMVHPCGMVAR